MEMSNRQISPFSVEVLMKINPRRVLDLGMGIGRWGMILREIFASQNASLEQIHPPVIIEGIFTKGEISNTYNAAFYDKIHFAEVMEILSSLQESWDVIIIEELLLHYEKEIAKSLLTRCLHQAAYLLVILPLVSEAIHDPTSSKPNDHFKSTWIENDFDDYGLRGKTLFLDPLGRSYGAFVLSLSDPMKLSLPGLITAASPSPTGVENALDSEKEYTSGLQLVNEQLLNELNLIKNSRSYRLVERLKTMPLAWFLMRLGKILLPDRTPQGTQGPKFTRGATIPNEVKNGSAEVGKISNVQALNRDVSLIQASNDQEWIERQVNNPLPLSVINPAWQGILASTRELFTNIVTINDDLDNERANYYARLFYEAQCPSITIQGFPNTYYLLVKAIRKISPKLPIYVIYHGNFLHVREDYDWGAFKLISDLYQDGDIAKVGFVKKGMAEVMASTGMRTAFIMNMVRRIPDAPSQALPNGKHVGIWGQPDWSWKKSPYAMLAALALVPDSFGHVFNVSPRTQEFSNLMGVKAEFRYNSVPQNQVLELMAKMHLNLYVTLTECAPMMPLESLSVGTPCLFGPTSHYFLDHDFLYQRLVVPYPDDAQTIAQYANRALDEREEIISAYRDYAPGYNLRARKALAEFLEFPLGEN